MKIQSSAVTMSAASAKTQLYAKSESLEILSRTDSAGKQTSSEAPAVLDLSASAEATKPLSQADPVDASKSDPFKLSDSDQLKLTLIQKLLEGFTGKKIRFFVADELEKSNHKTQPSENITLRAANSAPNSQGFGAIYRSEETYYERQSLSFSAAGIVNTSDGKTISLDLSLNMSREFVSSVSTELRMGSAVMVDPLVINFDAPSASLTEIRYAFDLDSDGSSELISFVRPGSGFLSLDINGDGVINDGSELFGTKSGDGFADLSAFDRDKNGWIDENDSIYDKLRIWTKDSNGTDTLLAMGKKGVGAIYLGNVSSSFDLRNDANQMGGEIRKTGIFLTESGKTGTVQHVDLAI